MNGPRGPLHPDAVPVTLGALLRRCAGRHPEREAVVAGDRRLTFREHLALVERVAWGLHRLGVRRGDHVALLMENRPEWLTVQMAALTLGAVVVPINTRYTVGEAEYVLRQSDTSTLVMVDRFRSIDFVEMVGSLWPDLAASPARRSERLPRLQRVICLGRHRLPGMVAFDELLASAPPAAALRELSAAVGVDDVATIVYTSGTTAFPKGVMLTHGQISRNMYEARVIQEELDPGERLLVVAPFVHIVGGINSVFGMLHAGGALVVMDHFDPEAALATIERERVTRFYGVTTMFVDILGASALGRYDTRTLRHVSLFPGPFRVEFLAELVGALRAGGVGVGWGMTETTNGATFVCSWRDGLERVATRVGKPRDQYELAIVDPETGEPLPTGTTGEIRVRGFNVMKGYYGKPDETARVIDGDGWLHTGDLGTIDDEGYLAFLGRLKEMVKTGGFNVSCAEVESTLAEHPAILEAAVVGVPDRRLTEVAAAFVRLRDGATCEASSLLAFCRERLARFKVPAHVRFVDAFPLSTTGKVQKFALRARLASELGLEGDTPDPTHTKGRKLA